MIWNLILELELTSESHRRRKLPALYRISMTKSVPWFFALDHTHYSRWLPVHLSDMVSLRECHPNINSEFAKGNFTVRKPIHKFSKKKKLKQY